MAQRDVALSFTKGAEFSTIPTSDGRIVVSLENDETCVIMPITYEEALEIASILIAAIQEVIE